MAKKNEIVKAIVAPRRTVRCDGKDYGPGAEVELDAGEAQELRAAGFLVDPSATEAPATGNGPEFSLVNNQEGAPTVTAG